MKRYVVKKMEKHADGGNGSGIFIKIYDEKTPPFDFIDTEENIRSKILGKYGPGRYQLITIDKAKGEEGTVNFRGEIGYKETEWKTWTKKERVKYIHERHYGKREKSIVIGVLMLIAAVAIAGIYVAVRVEFNPLLLIGMIIVLILEVVFGTFFYDLFEFENQV